MVFGLTLRWLGRYCIRKAVRRVAKSVGFMARPSEESRARNPPHCARPRLQKDQSSAANSAECRRDAHAPYTSPTGAVLHSDRPLRATIAPSGERRMYGAG